MTFDFAFTKEQLALTLPTNKQIPEWFDALSAILPKYNITSVSRVAAFIAQCAHESNNFTVIKENLNYRAEGLRTVFAKYFPNDALAQTYAHHPEMIANRVYASRIGNGNESTGDGFKFCGRGLIQLTGRSNYEKFAASCNKTLDETIDYLGTLPGALESACWFWNEHNLNALADNTDIMAITKKINGGTNGAADRAAKYKHALVVLGGV